MVKPVEPKPVAGAKGDDMDYIKERFRRLDLD
jgi:hypothetical protein